MTRGLESEIKFEPQERRFDVHGGTVTVRMDIDPRDGFPQVYALFNGVRYYGLRPAKETSLDAVREAFDITCRLAEKGELDPGTSHTTKPKHREAAAGPGKTRVAVAAAVMAIIAMCSTMSAPRSASSSEPRPVNLSTQLK